MRITILALGTRGDVQPSVALALKLLAAGHNVCLATEDEVINIFKSYQNISFRSLRGLTPGQLDALINEVKGRRYAMTRGYIKATTLLMRQRLADCLDVSRDADAIIYSPGAFFAGSVGEKLRVPVFPAYNYPVHPTSAFPSIVLGANGFRLRLGGAGNRLTHTIIRQAFWEPYRRSINEARQEVLGLPPLPWRPYKEMDRRRQPVLYTFSPSVLPKPADWGEWLHVTGYWFLDQPQAWQPPAALVDFLAAGPPPVYVGFGSVEHDTTQSTEQRAEVMVKALVRSRQRGLIYTGTNALSTADLPDEVFHVGPVPFDWLFPRVTGVVHHGGAGTTAASLRAGLPTGVVIYGADQALWGWRVHALGVGPRPIPEKQLSVERLAASIRAVATDERMHERAAALGARIRAEDGVGRAVAVIERYVAQHR